MKKKTFGGKGASDKAKANTIISLLKARAAQGAGTAPPMAGPPDAGPPDAGPPMAGPPPGAGGPPPGMKKGGKVVKKAEGGDVENENGPEAASLANAARMESYKTTVADTPASSDEGMSRGQAFRAARAAGKSTFMYAGKKYTTELASAAKPSTTVSGVEVVGKKPSTTVSGVEVVGTKPRTAAFRNIRTALMGTGAEPSTMKKGGKVTKSTKGSSARKKGTDMKKLASGGSFRSSANGVASKGKTKGKQVKMAAGGAMKGCK